MNYQEAISFLYAQLPVFHNVGKKAYKPGLGNVLALCDKLGNPQNDFKSLHIAGTNGKGSSSHFMASVLQEHGFKVGLYTSPHLKRFTERIKINGKEIPEAWVSQFVEQHQSHIQEIHPSFFEWTVAMAFCFFSEQQVDYAIIETGLGGRLDSTNIISPLACLITNIGYDHQDILGESLLEIASEKAGIIKKGIPVTISEYQIETHTVFEQMAETCESDIIFANRKIKPVDIVMGEHLTFEVPRYHTWKNIHVKSPYVGLYQVQNILGILAWSIQIQEAGLIPLRQEEWERGIENCAKNTGLKGRFEILEKKPWLIADTAHNEHGLRLLIGQIQEILAGQLIIILGMVADKDIQRALEVLPKHATYFFCQSGNPRSLLASQLQDKAQNLALKGICFENVNEAIARAKDLAQENDIILVTGSTYMVAEIDEL
jgi:dihydrofolate synthase/folylpolyglutamate synthase